MSLNNGDSNSNANNELTSTEKTEEKEPEVTANAIPKNITSNEESNDTNDSGNIEDEKDLNINKLRESLNSLKDLVEKSNNEENKSDYYKLIEDLDNIEKYNKQVKDNFSTRVVKELNQANKLLVGKEENRLEEFNKVIDKIKEDNKNNSFFKNNEGNRKLFNETLDGLKEKAEKVVKTDPLERLDLANFKENVAKVSFDLDNEDMEKCKSVEEVADLIIKRALKGTLYSSYLNTEKQKENAEKRLKKKAADGVENIGKIRDSLIKSIEEKAERTKNNINEIRNNLIKSIKEHKFRAYITDLEKAFEENANNTTYSYIISKVVPALNKIENLDNQEESKEKRYLKSRGYSTLIGDGGAIERNTSFITKLEDFAERRLNLSPKDKILKDIYNINVKEITPKAKVTSAPKLNEKKIIIYEDVGKKIKEFVQGKSEKELEPLSDALVNYTKLLCEKALLYLEDIENYRLGSLGLHTKDNPSPIRDHRGADFAGDLDNFHKSVRGLGLLELPEWKKLCAKRKELFDKIKAKEAAIKDRAHPDKLEGDKEKNGLSKSALKYYDAFYNNPPTDDNSKKVNILEPFVMDDEIKNMIKEINNQLAKLSPSQAEDENNIETEEIIKSTENDIPQTGKLNFAQLKNRKQRNNN